MRFARFASIALIAGCSRATPVSHETPNWAVSSTPTLTIGAGEAEPGHELSKVSGARMQHGVIIIANSGANELQRFDSAGRLLGIEGGKGKGPGEFVGIIGISPAPGDSLYVFDSENVRWSIHDGTGRYARTLTGGGDALARPAFLYHRIVIRGAAGAPVPTWMLALLDSLPESLSGSPTRQARIDDLGFLWVQDSAATRTWNVYANAGPAVGRVVLPAGFELIQEGKDFVLGRAKDSLDVELVRVYHLSRSTNAAPPAAGPFGIIPASDRTAQSKLFTDVQGAMTAQEAFYSDHGAYTANRDSLGVMMSSGAELVLLAGDKQHWAGLLYDKATRTTCGVSVGFPAPDGWLDGTVFCGR